VLIAYAHALNAIIGDLLITRDGATYAAGRLSGLITYYQLGDGHPIVGHSVPEFELVDGSSMSRVMHEGRGVLIDFGSNPALQDLARDYRDQVKYVSGLADDHFGLSAALIRPDGFVAWATIENPVDAGSPIWRWTRGFPEGRLGGVDKFEPVSGAGEMDHAEEAVGKLVVAGGDGAVDFQVAKHSLDPVALLVERPVMFDFDAAV
jgi:hypothetical protein